jgi:hypothetical protein
LTEGFSSQNTNVVQLLLEHDSASEEKLLGGTSKAQNSQNKEECSGINNAAEPSLEQLQGVLHEFQFLSTPDSVAATDTNQDTLLIRELVCFKSVRLVLEAFFCCFVYSPHTGLSFAVFPILYIAHCECR